MLDMKRKPRIDETVFEDIANKISVEALNYIVERRNETVLRFEYIEGDAIVIIKGYVQDEKTEPDIATTHTVFWKTEEMKKMKMFVKDLIEEKKSFITKTGDGFTEPITVIKWQVEVNNLRSKKERNFLNLKY